MSIVPSCSLTKPSNFADCSAGQLPYGWEAQCIDGVRTVYIDHVRQRTQLTDPRTAWRTAQARMVDDYLAAQAVLADRQRQLNVSDRCETDAVQELTRLRQRLTAAERRVQACGSVQHLPPHAQSTSGNQHLHTTSMPSLARSGMFCTFFDCRPIS